ncbi:MAG: hypothetical protein E7553_07410 [Ruminococcaceae bacterium]|nr:hypothetical protein [Oscillospiraceae bacterium]
MGFFSKLSRFFRAAQDVAERVSEMHEDAAAPAGNEFRVETGSDPCFPSSYPTDDAYFASVITAEALAPYTLETDVHVSRFDANAHPKCYPVSFLISDASGPVLAVFVMNRNQYRAMIALGAYEVLDQQGIEYIRFFKGMKNDREYVLNRIREHLPS